MIRNTDTQTDGCRAIVQEAKDCYMSNTRLFYLSWNCDDLIVECHAIPRGVSLKHENGGRIGGVILESTCHFEGGRSEVWSVARGRTTTLSLQDKNSPEKEINSQACTGGGVQTQHSAMVRCTSFLYGTAYLFLNQNPWISLTWCQAMEKVVFLRPKLGEPWNNPNCHFSNSYRFS